MNIIKKVSINGFWNDKNVILNFKSNVNFLIGPNGSGKTTIINLIAAALGADFSTLDRLQFRKIVIDLEDKQSNSDKKSAAFIEIEKIDKENSPYQTINFKIKSQNDSKPIEYILNEIEEEQLYRYPREVILHRRRIKDGKGLKAEKDIYMKLKELLNLTWLSIHRISSVLGRKEERGFESSVDMKIEELQNNLVKYFSKLNGLYADETKKFQKFIFESLISQESKSSISSFYKDIDADKEKESLNEIFMLFEIDKSNIKLNEFFKYYNLAVEKFENENKIEITDLAYILNIRRIHLVAQKWNELVEKQKEINKSRDVFLNVINNLLSKKNLKINDRNELVVCPDNGKDFRLVNLSSGEKQLVIFLGQSLLQESNTHIYIADEPELSLHVDWQEKLVNSLKSINPNSQIIFATHSPDIVSTYSDAVIKIEDAIK